MLSEYYNVYHRQDMSVYWVIYLSVIAGHEYSYKGMCVYVHALLRQHSQMVGALVW